MSVYHSCQKLTLSVLFVWGREAESYMSGRSRVLTHAAYSSSSSLEIRIFRPSTSISLLSTQFGRAARMWQREG